MKTMKNRFKKLSMQMVSWAGMFSAVMIVNFFCPFFSHQEREPESVRKLRKF